MLAALCLKPLMQLLREHEAVQRELGILMNEQEQETVDLITALEVNLTAGQGIKNAG